MNTTTVERTRTVVIVKHVTARPCTHCEKPLRRRRVHVRVQTEKGLSFGVGSFCSVACLMRFARARRRERKDSIRGWAFGEKRA